MQRITQGFIFSLILFFAFSFSIFAHSSRANLKEYNVSNPLSMCYTSGLGVIAQVHADEIVSSKNSQQYSSSSLLLSIASRYFGLSANLDSAFSGFNGVESGTYSHNFDINFAAGVQRSGLSFAAVWKLGGLREKQVTCSSEHSFLRLFECIFTQHNDNYIVKNTSSLSLYLGYDNFKHFSFSIFADDLLSFDNTGINLSSSQALDGIGFSFMLNTSKYDSQNIKKNLEFYFLCDFEKLFSYSSLSISPQFNLRLNIIRKCSILFTQRFEFLSFSSRKAFLDDSLHISSLDFELYNYNISLSLLVPLATYTPSGNGIFRMALSLKFFHT